VGRGIFMLKMNSKNHSLINEKLKLEISVLKMDLVKREAELELIKEDIITKKFARRVLKLTTTLTGLSLIVTVLVHFGIIPKS
jgi:hypothetical protein